MLDDNGHPIEDRIYNAADMNRNLVLGLRDRVVAGKITEYLKGTDRNAKTIVFCEDVDHAQRMTAALAQANKDICATRQIRDADHWRQRSGQARAGQLHRP
jgi:type I restriction enzyme R subunit